MLPKYKRGHGMFAFRFRVTNSIERLINIEIGSFYVHVGESTFPVPTAWFALLPIVPVSYNKSHYMIVLNNGQAIDTSDGFIYRKVG